MIFGNREGLLIRSMTKRNWERICRHQNERLPNGLFARGAIAAMFKKYSLFLYLLLLTAAVVVHVILRQIRRKSQRYDPRSNDFDIADLQRLVATGQMTPEECEKAKSVILSRSDATFEPAKGFPVLAPREQPKGDGDIDDCAL